MLALKIRNTEQIELRDDRTAAAGTMFEGDAEPRKQRRK